MKTSNVEFNAYSDLLTSQSEKLPLSSVLKHALQGLLHFFTNGDELQVWTTTDQNGSKSWHAYDPVKDCSVTRDSEAEIRTWIEQRYYQ